MHFDYQNIWSVSDIGKIIAASDNDNNLNKNSHPP
jgi:hypothetical protein